MNESRPSAADALTPDELHRALADAQAETAELHRELAALRLRQMQQMRELELLTQIHGDAGLSPPQRARRLASLAQARTGAGRQNASAPHLLPGGRPDTIGRRVKDRLLRSPLRHPLLPVWRLYVESGARDAVNRVRSAISSSLRR
ncbi:hypothetical protein ACI6QG_13585 [Roseococcus sp. DSY-14]|uniref:hypothetical protein n=1 Tax=Roseococcus sp. DSY-14 TaxID=3369650 RepID=UPI00387B7A56